MLVEINAAHPEPRKVQRAVSALEAGEVIAYPTDTVYGLGCDFTNKKAVERLYAIKKMDRAQPLALICADLAEVAKYAVVEKGIYRILRHFLPGPYCFILDATRETPKLLQSKRKQVGIRIPDHAVTTAIVRELGRPLISSTAVLPGGEPLIDPDEIDDAFDGLALVLDGGVGGTVPTTVIDLTSGTPEVIREGAGPIDQFLAV